MTERISFVPGNGISVSDPTTEAEPSRHRLVRNCHYTLGHVGGRDSERSYCLEELKATDPTVTHSGCQNSFHDHCFDEVLASNPLLLIPNPEPSKCPMCNDLLYPWPALVGVLPPAEHAAREAARQVATAEAERRRRAANTQAERAFAEAPARREAEGIGAVVPPDIAVAIRILFAELDEIERRRQALQKGNFMAIEEVAEQRNATLAALQELAEGSGDDEVLRVVDARIRIEVDNMAAELAAMQEFLAGLNALRTQFGVPEIELGEGGEGDKEEDQE